jgi:5-methylcytosine-specific restriction enzyme A
MAKRPKVWRSPHVQSARDYDRARGSAAERGYGSRWAKAAKGWLRAHPLCVGCLARGRPVAAVLVDHVVPHRGDMVLFWDSSKWQSLCKWDHDVVKQRLEAMYVKGLLGVDDLRLDSAAALRVADGEGAGGAV